MDNNNDHNKLKAGLFLVALGIVYGDIGTSPLYVFKAIIGNNIITKELVWGGLSCIFWTITLLTTVKYVTLILRADNKGEGGIFSLYSLVRRRNKWLFLPTMVGGSALLADGIITPPISVSSAIEGLRILYPSIPTVPIVVAIIVLLFSVQHFGSSKVGKSFGPIMVIWFGMLSIFGIWQLTQNFEILHALNPLHALNLLFVEPNGFWVLGAVFLCTTGAEALYSDLGHCGKANIRASWVFVKTSLLLNYFGQGAWLLLHEGQTLNGANPFYAMLPNWFLVPAIIIATLATIIASQALISGSFTLVAEAVRLYFLPKVRIVYPSVVRGQIYVPVINFMLLLGCIGVVLYFQESSNMEAAYGLAITITMLVDTVLFSFFMHIKRFHWSFITLFLVVFLTIETAFLGANIVKFWHGGWVAIVVGGIIFSAMWIWHHASMLKRRYTEYVPLEDHIQALKDLSADQSIPKYSTHVVYMTGAPVTQLIESKIVYSLFHKTPKRADVYWFIHVAVSDDPYTVEYEVTTLVEQHAFRIDFNLGFRLEPRINVLFREVLEDMSENNEVDLISRYDSLRKNGITGDFRFVVLEKALSTENELPVFEKFIMNCYQFLKNFSLSEEKNYGLDTSAVISEKVPLLLTATRDYGLKRVYQC